MKQLGMAAFSLIAVLGSAQAHHSRASFDLNNDAAVKARITEVRWANPHVFYIGEVTSSNGEKEVWTFEGHSTIGHTRQGWLKDAVKVGDEVRLVVNRHRDPRKHFALIDHVRMADGRVLYALGRPLPRATAPVQPSKDFSGNWQFRLPGTPEQINQRLIVGSGGPQLDLPYTEKGRTQVAAYDPNKNPSLNCEPASLPGLLTAIFDSKWIRSGDRIVIRREVSETATRLIHLKNTTAPADYRPNPLGYSVGRFEADGTFMVETMGFSPVRWGNGPGVDSSERKRIVERYKLIDGGMAMSLAYTQEDPVYFTEPITRAGTYIKTPDRDFAPQPPCDINAAQQHLKFE